MRVVVRECDNFLFTCYVLTTGPKANQNLSFTWCSDLRITANPKGGISYIPWCIASYYIIKLPNARDPISSTGTWQLNNGGERLVLSIKLSVPLLCRSIYDVRFTIPNTSLVKSTSVLAADYELTSLTIARQSTQMFLEASEEGFCFNRSCFNVHW